MNKIDNPHFVKTLRTHITLAPCEGCAADNNLALCKKLKTEEDFCGDYFFKPKVYLKQINPIETSEKIESMQDDIERLTNALVESESRADNLQKRAEAFQAAYVSGVEKRTDLVKVIDALKSGEPVALVKTIGGYPDDSVHTIIQTCEFNQLKDGDFLYLHSNPNPPLLSDAEINKSFPGGFRTDEYESGFYDGARWAESKVYLCSKPIHKPLTNDEIENIQSKIPDWDDHEYSLSFARAIEAKVRAQYEN